MCSAVSSGTPAPTKKAVLISNKYPFPGDDGKKAVLAGLASYFLDRYGSDNFIYIVIGSRIDTSAFTSLGQTLFVDPPGLITQVFNVLSLPFRSNLHSLQEALTWSPRVNRNLHSLVEKLSPEVVVLDTVRIGNYFVEREGCAGRFVLYMDDLFYLRFDRIRDIRKKYKGLDLDPVGTFAPNIPAFSRILLRSRRLQGLLFRLEFEGIRKREMIAPGQFDRCLLLNPNEAADFAEVSGADNVCAIKPLLSQPDLPVERCIGSTPVFLLFGSLRHPVYRSSVIRFMEVCGDEIRRLLPRAKILVVGEGADQKVRDLANRYSGTIELMGYVDDLESLFASVHGILVPILASGGLKLKVLTALCHGIPIISTPEGMDGITAQHGENCMIGDELEQFPGLMQQVCDPALNSQLSRNARATFLEEYSRKRVCDEYDEIFPYTGEPG